MNPTTYDRLYIWSSNQEVMDALSEVNAKLDLSVIDAKPDPTLGLPLIAGIDYADFLLRTISVKNPRERIYCQFYFDSKKLKHRFYIAYKNGKLSVMKKTNGYIIPDTGCLNQLGVADRTMIQIALSAFFQQIDRIRKDREGNRYLDFNDNIEIKVTTRIKQYLVTAWKFGRVVLVMKLDKMDAKDIGHTIRAAG